jgi:hypothetical protein
MCDCAVCVYVCAPPLLSLRSRQGMRTPRQEEAANAAEYEFWSILLTMPS